MNKKVALNKRDRERIKKVLTDRKNEILSDLMGNETQVDKYQEPKADELDKAVDAGAMELLVALGDTERRELEEILVALEKIENGTYGICEACLEEPLHMCPTCPNIPKARLEALPTARLCVACQEAEERNQIPSYTRLRPRRVIFSDDMEEFSHPLMEQQDEE
ncbi:MAG: TraR/DksA family transcriptional regulator [Candidatus Latescibacterota bacterium]